MIEITGGRRAVFFITTYKSIKKGRFLGRFNVDNYKSPLMKLLGGGSE